MKGIDRIKKLRNAILNETTNFCVKCNLRENCIENECIIFRIESIVEKYIKRKGEKYESRRNSK